MGKGQITIIPKLEFEDLSSTWKGSTEAMLFELNFFGELLPGSCTPSGFGW